MANVSRLNSIVDKVDPNTGTALDAWHHRRYNHCSNRYLSLSIKSETDKLDPIWNSFTGTGTSGDTRQYSVWRYI